MAKIIPFPKPQVQLTEEEAREYEQLKSEIDRIQGLRDLFMCKRKVKAFLKKVKDRNETGR